MSLARINRRYDVVRPLGEGGMGTVYLVEDSLNRRSAALKTLPASGSSARLVQVLKHEFGSMAALSHPHLAEVYDFGRIDEVAAVGGHQGATPLAGREGDYFFTSEFVDGVDFRTAARAGGLARVYDLAVQVCRALQYIHARGQVHLDIKPDNLLVAERAGAPTVKLIDFGLASTRADGARGRPAGTVQYLAPEVYTGQPVDGRSDLYSLGIVLYEVLTGELPFQGPTATDVIYGHLNTPPTPPAATGRGVPDGVSDLVLRLIAKEPADRFHAANEVIQAIGRCAGRDYEVETSETRRAYVAAGRLVGRTAELDRLRAVYAEVFEPRSATLAPQPHGVLVRGGVGLGKSRLVREFSLWCALHDVRVVNGRCYERAGAPLDPFPEVVREAWLCGAEEALDERERAALAVAVGGLEAPTAAAPAARATGGATAGDFSMQLAEALPRLVAAMARRGPAVLVLEDLHWASSRARECLAATLRHLQQLRRERPHAPPAILVLATARPPESEPAPPAEGGDPLGAVAAELAEEGALRVLDLAPLGAADVNDWLGSMLGERRLPEDFPERLAGHTGGNPLLISEVLKSLVEDGVLAWGEGAWELVRDRPLEGAAGERHDDLAAVLAQVVNRRVDALDRASLALLRALAVFQTPRPVEDLARVAALAEEACYRSARTLEGRGLLARVGESSLQFRFAHDATREVVYRTTPPARRAVLHRRAVAALEQAALTAPESLAGELATHAAAAGLKDRALHWGLRAAEGARALGAHDRAAFYLTIALEACEDPVERARLRDRLASLHFLAGAFEPALALYERALKEAAPPLLAAGARREGPPEPARAARLHRAAGDCHARMGRYSDALHHYEEALERSGRTGAAAADVLERVARLHCRRGEHPRAVHLCLEAMNLLGALPESEREAARPVLAAVHDTIGLTRLHQQDYEGACEALQRARAAWEALGDASGEATTLDHMGLAHHRAGNLSQASRLLRAALRLRREAGDVPGIAASLDHLGLICHATGDTQGAWDCFRQSIDLRERIHDAPGLAETLDHLGRLSQAMGQVEPALEHLGRALAIRERIGDNPGTVSTLANLGAVYEGLGDYGRAVDYFRRTLSVCEAAGDPVGHARSLLDLAGVYLRVGMPDLARDLVVRGEELARSDPSGGSRARQRLAAGRLALLERRAGEAGALVAEAVAGFLASGRREEATLATLDLVEARLRESRPDLASDLLDGVEGDLVEVASRARYHLLRGRTARARGQRAKALEQLSLAMERAAEARDSEVHLAACHALARHHHESGNARAASEYYKWALEGIRDVWVRLAGPMREAYIQDPRRSVPREDAIALRRDAALGSADLLEGGEPSGAPPSSLAPMPGSPAAPAAPLAAAAGAASAAGAGLGERRRRSREQLAALLETARDLAGESDLQRLLPLVLDRVIALVRAERGFLALVPEDGAGPPDASRLEFLAARNFDRETVRRPETRVSRSILERVLAAGEPVLTAAADQDPRFVEAASVDELRLRSVLGVPLRARGRVTGLVVLDNRFQDHAFDEEDAATVAAVADHAALAIENARLLGAAHRQAEELGRARAELDRAHAELARRLERKTEELGRVRTELALSRSSLDLAHPYDEIVGRSKPMREVFRLLDKVVETNLPVLIQGESGTGKELIARAIHRNSVRRGGPFVSENCAAIPEGLLESELFGHVAGAFTGAHKDKKGLLAAASGGTIFLDEVADMPASFQAKLLRVLQEGEVRPVGSTETFPVDARVISAANRDLAALVEEGGFREDLYYRLAVVRIALPPLRERREDLEPLALALLARAAAEGGREPPRLDRRALDALLRHDWPGNVRELENEMRRLAAVAGESIRLEDLSPQVRSGAGAAAATSGGGAGAPVAGPPLTLEEAERRAILAALEAASGNKVRAAEILGIPRTSLYHRLKKLGL